MKTDELYIPGTHPIRAAQFGTGNFLRAFADYMIDAANEKGYFNGDIVMVKQVPGTEPDRLQTQGGKYHVILQGKRNGMTVDEVRTVSAVRGTINPCTDYDAYQALARLDSLRFVISNTTEAGIVFDENDRFDSLPAASFPGRLVQFLYERYRAFGGDTAKGLIILPVELIADNGYVLKECVLKLIRLWKLGDPFADWVKEANIFCSTLVDRIVSGKIPQLGSRFPEDSLYTAAEPFGLWVIAADRDISEELPLHKAGMPVIFTNDLRPFRERKVRVLNGTHTAMALISYLCGADTVAEAMSDPLLRQFIDRVCYDELAPAVPLPPEDTRRFADEVMERFENPFLNHRLLDISLNSVSKWKTRDLPSLKDSLDAGRTPKLLIFSLAALLAFDTVAADTDGWLLGRRPDGSLYPIHDDRNTVSAIQTETDEDVQRILSDTTLWGEDLSFLSEQVCVFLSAIRRDGPRMAVEALLRS